jgi:hypothetical protein
MKTVNAYLTNKLHSYSEDIVAEIADSTMTTILGAALFVLLVLELLSKSMGTKDLVMVVVATAIYVAAHWIEQKAKAELTLRHTQEISREHVTR